MAEVQLRTLRVSAELDSSAYTAGMNEKIAADRAGAASSTQVDQKISATVGSFERLKRQYIDGYGAAARLQSALDGISRGLERGAFTADEAARAVDGVIHRHGLMANSADFVTRGQMEMARAIEVSNARLNQQASIAQRTQNTVSRTPVNDNMNSADANRRQNLGYQLFDIGQTASLGMSPAMILMQQGPQIAQLYAMQGGLNAAMRDFMAILGGVARVAGPIVGVIAGIYGAYRLLERHSVSAGLAVSDATRALADQAAPIESLRGKINELAQVQTDFNRAIAESALNTGSAADAIIANSKREYDARKALLDLELLLQEAKLKTLEADLAIKSQEMRERIAPTIANDNGRSVRSGFADPAINGGIPFVRLPDEISGVQKAMDAVNSDPAKAEIAKLRAEMTLAELMVQKFREALAKPFDVAGDPLAETWASRYNAAQLAKQQAYRDMYNPVPNFPNGVPVPQQRPLDGPDDPIGQKTNGAYSSLVAQIEARQQLFQSQSQDIEKLRLEAQLVGASARERASLTAALQAEHQLRQAGVDLLSQEGQAYKANAIAIAQARLEIERQNAAYTSLQQSGGSAIDALTVGTGSLRDRLKSAADTMLQWIQQLAIANPLKNSLFGTNLPTMGDLFSGRPSMPGSTTTGSMMVTAGTVMVNGGVTGGLTSGFPISPGGNTLGSVLGVANQNTPVAANQNPALAGLMNDPSLTNRAGLVTDPSTRALMYRQSISQIESGSFAGNYNALGPITRTGDRAYGRYQVMGANVPSWTEQHYGQRLTPSQFHANPAAQDAVFDGEFGSYVSKYGEGPAATKWFTGSHIAKGRQDILGTTDTSYSNQFNANMQKLSVNSAAASKDIGTLGDSSAKVSTTITDSLTKVATPAAVPQMPVATPTATASNPFSSFFGGFFKLLGFADGTDFSPGGLAMVGERGRELVNLPRGSQVVPTHKLSQLGGRSEGPRAVNHNYSFIVTGNGDKELMARMQMMAESTVRGGIAAYDSALPDRIESYQQDPFNRAAA